MNRLPHSLTFGVEEEFFILPKSREVTEQTYESVEKIVAALGTKFPQRAKPEPGGGRTLVWAEQELFKLQVELKTAPCRSVAQARTEILENRRFLKDILAQFDFLAYPSGTHPTQDWRGIKRKRKELHTLAFKTALADEMAVNGMHVHVGVPHDGRFGLFNFLRGFLPLFLALSSSSAFWQGKETGLLSYRPSIFGVVPRGGLPSPLTEKQFDDYLRALTLVEEQGEEIQAHWFLRPSAFYPTVEVRIMDMCPSVDDAMAIVALIACLSEKYFSDLRGAWENGSAPEPLAFFANPPQHLFAESVWRVQKHGLKAKILAETGGRIQTFELNVVLPRIVEILTPAADRLGCRVELLHLLTILDRGASSERQLAAYRTALAMVGEDRGAEAVEAASQSILLDFGYTPEEIR